MKTKTRRYAITYLPKEDAWNVKAMKKGDYVLKKYQKNTSIIRGTSRRAALRKLSARSYYAETGKRLRRKK